MDRTPFCQSAAPSIAHCPPQFCAGRMLSINLLRSTSFLNFRNFRIASKVILPFYGNINSCLTTAQKPPWWQNNGAVAEWLKAMVC